MSKILQIKKVTETREVTIGHRCDCCKDALMIERLPDEWHRFSSHHNHWGNDSHESVVYYEVCSPSCYFTKLQEIVDEMIEYVDAEIDGMQIQFARTMVKHINLKKSK